MPACGELVLDRLRQADGNPESERKLSIDQVVLTAGSNQLLHLVADALLDPGDIVFCATPTYFVFLGVLGNLGARAWGIASDAEGIIPAAVDEQLRQFRAPRRAGPRESDLRHYLFRQSDQRHAVAARGGRNWSSWPSAGRGTSKIYLIEDAAYRPLRYAGDDLPSLRSFDTTRRNGDRGRDVFQIVFARHPGRLGHSAAGIWSSRSRA